MDILDNFKEGAMSQLASLSMALHIISCIKFSYNKSVTFLFVDTNALLNAGQVFEPVSCMQAGCSCATVRGAEAIIAMTNPLVRHDT